MTKSELYSDLLIRYQEEGVPQKMSIEGFCFRHGVDYTPFIRWYRLEKKRRREFESAEMKVTPVYVTGTPVSGSGVSPTVSSGVDKSTVNVSSFALVFENGLEIKRSGTNVESLMMLLQNLSSIC